MAVLACLLRTCLRRRREPSRTQRSPHTHRWATPCTPRLGQRSPDQKERDRLNTHFCAVAIGGGEWENSSCLLTVATVRRATGRRKSAADVTVAVCSRFLAWACTPHPKVVNTKPGSSWKGHRRGGVPFRACGPAGVAVQPVALRPEALPWQGTRHSPPLLTEKHLPSPPLPVHCLLVKEPPCSDRKRACGQGRGGEGGEG